MRKLSPILFLAGAVNVMGLDSAWAYGGGCGMSGGGGYGGGRAVASRKALGGGANLAQARPQAIRQVASLSASRRAVAVTTNHSTANQIKTAATTTAKVSKAAPKKPIYTCPMHPQIQSTSAVDCPICGMKLKPKLANKPDGKGAPKEAGEQPCMEGMEGMGDMSGMEGAEGMDGMMMCCPGCMGVGGMSGMNGGKGSPKASGKATSRGSSMGAMAGMRCGC